MLPQGKILSITIPTWNRARILPGILDQLCDQIIDSHIEDEVELFISNNGSNDNTEEVCLKYKQKFNFITYHNNGTNIGARDNVLSCFEMAVGKYLILFGDDDRINSDSINLIVQMLKSNEDIDLFFDSTSLKSNPFTDGTKINLKQFVASFYYHVGNAGLFIYKTELAKYVFHDHPFSFFNKSWPQTQLMILGIKNNERLSCLIKNLHINAPGLHDEVMVYSSYYLFRTTYFDLIESINSIKNEIDISIYNGARLYLKLNILQISFNILQCGIFVDDAIIRKKTRDQIVSNLNSFKSKEWIFMSIISIAFSLPTLISKPFSNMCILLLKGPRGLLKKNKFVLTEKRKKLNQLKSLSQEIREFSF